MIHGWAFRSTRGAREGATALGFDFDGMLAVILALSTSDFYKSMTMHNDHRVWQDVYRAATVGGEVYLKLTVIDDVIIVSFKEM
ncbi:type II toxin-antitoxin system MqsR family toxin [Undibacterium sp.]|uniref:type II toxin-antitoxin system MqsR family toxin n=1 Tax=Undibacterium sp. TaxID=1914977 RepID=UPI00351D53C4